MKRNSNIYDLNTPFTWWVIVIGANIRIYMFYCLQYAVKTVVHMDSISACCLFSTKISDLNIRFFFKVMPNYSELCQNMSVGEMSTQTHIHIHTLLPPQ